MTDLGVESRAQETTPGVEDEEPVIEDGKPARKAGFYRGRRST